MCACMHGVIDISVIENGTLILQKYTALFLQNSDWYIYKDTGYNDIST